MAQILYTDPGLFYFTIDILDPVGGARGSGGAIQGSTFASGVQAAVLPLTYMSNTETSKSQQTVPEVTHKVVVRYQSLPVDSNGYTKLRSRMYVQFKNRQLDIIRIKDPDERQVELHLICTERNDGQ